MADSIDAYSAKLLASPLAIQLIGESGVDEEVHEKRLISEFLKNEVGAFVEVGANHPFIGSQSFHQLRLFRKMYLGLPFRILNARRRRRRQLARAAAERTDSSD